MNLLIYLTLICSVGGISSASGSLQESWKTVSSNAEMDESLRDAGNELVVVEFYRNVGRHSISIARDMEKLAQRYSDVVMIKVDIDKASNVSERYGIYESPEFMFIKNNETLESGVSIEDVEKNIIYNTDPSSIQISWNTVSSTVELDEALQNAGNKLVVVQFYRDWCPHSKSIARDMEKLAQRYPDVLMIKVDIEHAEDVEARFHVSATSTFAFFRNGRILINGVRRKNVESTIKKYAKKKVSIFF